MKNMCVLKNSIWKFLKLIDSAMYLNTELTQSAIMFFYTNDEYIEREIRKLTLFTIVLNSIK